MLSDDLERYVTLYRTLGYKFRTQRAILRSFVAYAEDRGDTIIRAERIRSWAIRAPSAEHRCACLLTVRRFALALHAEDFRHEVPSSQTFGRGLAQRKIPYIYSPEEIARLLAGAASLEPTGSLRALTYTTLFGLLAATGMRSSEALALRRCDITADGLVIEKTKFKKSRLLPLHPTTNSAIEHYISVRTFRSRTDAVFVTRSGLPLSYYRVARTFADLAVLTGLRQSSDQLRPRLHDLRHSFAVRSLEQCTQDPDAVARHMTGLSTYLGHAHVTDTYWYLQATPSLLTRIADASEALHRGDVI